MPHVDFNEIPEANTGSGDQDRFESFARDFLEAIGFKILEGPGRGADRGRDLLVAERVAGEVSDHERKWVVSAKHRAHSKRAVAEADEPDPIGRVHKFTADGFLGFYSTLPSSGLDDVFARMTGQVAVHVFDAGRIEGALLSRPTLQHVFQQYFPDSYRRWQASRGPVPLLGEVSPLNCMNCGTDLLTSNSAVIVYVEQRDDDKIHVRDIYWACKGVCDRELKALTPDRTATTWIELADLRIPIMFMKHICAWANNAQRGVYTFSDEAHSRRLDYLLALSQAVVRETSADQQRRIETLQELPPWAGGL